MGASVSWLSGMLFSKKEIRILILGLVSGGWILPSYLDDSREEN